MTLRFSELILIQTYLSLQSPDEEEDQLSN